MDNQDQAVIEAINAHAGLSLTRTGRAADGTLGGAIFVEFPDGRTGVVTRYLGTPAEAQRTANVLARTKDQGLPVPLHHTVATVGGEVFVVQERLPGSPPAAVTTAVIDAIIEVNDRFAHLLADRPEVPSLPFCLTTSGDPYSRHEVLADHSDRSRRILAAIRAVGRELPGKPAGDDLLHVDLTPPNVLFDEAGEVTGVVDWNLGVFRGDRHRALVKTRFELEWALRSAEPGPDQVAAAARLDQVLAERVTEPELRRYWAHRMLDQLHWVLQFGPPDVVGWHLDVAEERLLEPY